MPSPEARIAQRGSRAVERGSVSTDISRPSLPCRAGASARSARRAGRRSRGSPGASPARRRAGARRSGTAAPSRRRSRRGPGRSWSSRSRIRAQGTVTAGEAAPGAPIASRHADEPARLVDHRPARDLRDERRVERDAGARQRQLGRHGRRDGGRADRDARQRRGRRVVAAADRAQQLILHRALRCRRAAGRGPGCVDAPPAARGRRRAPAPRSARAARRGPSRAAASGRPRCCGRRSARGRGRRR